jgi:hypothetical protein
MTSCEVAGPLDRFGGAGPEGSVRPGLHMSGRKRGPEAGGPATGCARQPAGAVRMITLTASAIC